MSVCAQTSGDCPEHAAELQPTDDIQTRLSLHHSLWMAQRHDIERLQDAEDRQDAALTEIESAVAELGGLFDRLTQLERAVEEMRRLVARANLRDRA